jgi:ubiquinone/menaquinone biosynthesis C-methylase UbiE
MQEPSSGFEDIDQAADPRHFVHIVDLNNQFRGEIRRQTYAALGVGKGDHILDAGCGTGEVARELAELVGPTGRVVGVDRSQTMIAEARRRSEGLNLSVEYQLGDVYHLDFADNSFDGCRAEWLFLHLARPAKALLEMCRVMRSGGRVVIVEQDAEARIVDSPDLALTRKMLNYSCSELANAWVGRQLPRLFHQAGLTEVMVSPQVLIQTDFRRGIAGLNSLALVDVLTHAQASGLVSAAEANTWVRQLQEASEADRFFSAVIVIMVSGRKP